MKRILKKITGYINRKKASLSSKNGIKYAKKLGVKIADQVRFTGVPDYGSEPWLVEIKKNAFLTAHIQFITHEGSVENLRRLDEKYKSVIKFGKIVIEEGAFIGRNVIILPNVRVGKGAIVGAFSCVTKDVPDGMVVGGVPAKVICSVQEMADKYLENTPIYDNEELQSNKVKVSTEIAEHYWNLKKEKI